MKLRTIASLFLILVGVVSGAAQVKPTIDDALSALRSGDPFRAVLTLNDVIAQNPGDGHLIARAQAIRAQAFLSMQQPDRAQTAVDLARKADPAYTPSAEDVGSDVVAMFSGAGRVGVPPAKSSAPPSAAAPTVARPAPAAPSASVPRTTSGLATIFVYRESHFVGSASKIDIDCNGVRIAQLQNGRTVQFTAPAGEIELRFRGDKPLQFATRAGATYYMKVAPGGMNFNTEEVSAETAQAYLKDKKPKPNDAKYVHFAECKAR